MCVHVCVLWTKECLCVWNSTRPGPEASIPQYLRFWKQFRLVSKESNSACTLDHRRQVTISRSKLRSWLHWSSFSRTCTINATKIVNSIIEEIRKWSTSLSSSDRWTNKHSNREIMVSSLSTSSHRWWTTSELDLVYRKGFSFSIGSFELDQKQFSNEIFNSKGVCVQVYF